MKYLTLVPEVKRPRYVRINTNLLTTSDAIGAFQDEGYRFIRCTSGAYDDYLNQIQNLTEYDFTQDYHVKTMFVFAPGTKMHDHELYLESKIILQDKATAMAVHLLAPPPGSVALDMCAAPGMKTTQLAAYLRNNGIIHAIERSEKRYQTLCDFVQRTQSACVKPVHKDVLDIRRGEYMDVEYILLDPSCSGSGMDLSVHNYIEEVRLAKLTSLQEKFLKHAMNSFPNAKRIVYSTCSIFPEENERVITNVVKTSRAKWRVLDVKELLKGQWKNFGSAMYGSIGTRCMYAKPDSDFTTGFFLAVLDRDPKDLEKCEVKSAERSKSQKQRSVNVELEHNDKSINDTVFPRNRLQHENEHVDTDRSENIPTEPAKKKKKHKKGKEDVNNLVENFEELNVEQENGCNEQKVRKKRKHKSQNEESLIEIIDGSNIVTENLEVPKKKKKQLKDVNHSEAKEQTAEECEIIPSAKKEKRKRAKSEKIDTEMQVDDANDMPKKKKKKKDKNYCQ
ncbi:hypothetical protein K1T71_003731 [Dendrolimus kikuchii]|uniref:Uncharacterized protein n=1 Tax=Dendrolimus kikuchii TaxID=765133 RepID=A0ACC1D9S8_9NEOP|nr:hypothetical protein K1T71_003731 [Dendrolimus kikuchii]